MFFYFMNILIKRNNILCEYVMLKQAMKDCIKLFNFSNAEHVKNLCGYDKATLPQILRKLNSANIKSIRPKILEKYCQNNVPRCCK